MRVLTHMVFNSISVNIPPFYIIGANVGSTLLSRNKVDKADIFYLYRFEEREKFLLLVDMEYDYQLPMFIRLTCFVSKLFL